MAPRKTRRQKQKQKGGFRRVKVTVGEAASKEGVLYGIDKETGNYVVYIAGKLVSVEPAAVEFLNAAEKGALNKTCATCGLNPQRLTQKNLFERSMNLAKARSGLHVPQASFTIQPREVPVLTYGLATCTVLSMVIGTKRFLAHIDAEMDVMPLILAIVETIKAEKARPSEVKVWTGLGGSANNAEESLLKNSPSFYSFQNVQRILSVLQIESFTLEDACFAEVVGL
jgi:hypothetical protein